jgi:hypothetical protein
MFLGFYGWMVLVLCFCLLCLAILDCNIDMLWCWVGRFFCGLCEFVYFWCVIMCKKWYTCNQAMFCRKYYGKLY